MDFNELYKWLKEYGVKTITKVTSEGNFVFDLENETQYLDSEQGKLEFSLHDLENMSKNILYWAYQEVQNNSDINVETILLY